VLKIQRALLAELLVGFLLITFVVTGAVFGGFTLRFVASGGDALGAELMLTLMPKLIPIALTYSVPFAWLAAVALTLGRWVADHECVALKAAGVHLRTIVVPVIAMGCLLGFAGMFYNAYRVPIAHREVRSSIKDFVPKFLASLKGSDRSVALNRGRLSWDRFDAETNEFVGAVLDRRGRGGKPELKAVARRLGLDQIRSDEGVGLLFTLEDAYFFRWRSGDLDVAEGPGNEFSMGRVKTIGASTTFNQFFSTNRFLYKPKDMVLPELYYVAERGGVPFGSVTDARVALHGRLALGSAAFFLGLFAVGMALVLPPSGRRVRDFLLCFLPAVLVYAPLMLAGTSLAKSGTFPPWLAMWSPNIVLTLCATVLLSIGLRK